MTQIRKIDNLTNLFLDYAESIPDDEQYISSMDKMYKKNLEENK